MPRLYTITSEWIEQQWFSTGGTRAKKYLLSPEGCYFYFKRSQFKPATESKPGKDFKFEFWNEILAFEIGTLLGFDVLQYDLAIDGEIMGCISESMINSDDEELIEGVKYIQANFPKFDPAKKEYRSAYTFDLIESALNDLYPFSFIENLIELIIFDALIGNGDRHQENWAVISIRQLLADRLESGVFSASSKRIAAFMKKRAESFKSKNIELPPSFYSTDRKFAPIYDSGSSLGRELLPEKVELFLHSEKDLKEYVLKGTSEIHWDKKKVSHFDLIRNLLASKYSLKVKEIIGRVIALFDLEKIGRVIDQVDVEVPESHAEYRIPEARKRLIKKIITLRFETLKTLINEGI